MSLSLEFLRDKRVGVVGMGVTGMAAFDAAVPFAHSVICYDDNTSQLADEYFSLYEKLDSPAWLNVDLIIMSPGCPTTYPAPHPIYLIAKQNNIPICSDIDLLYQAQADKSFIAVTGTNGKSTTVSLIHHILQSNAQDFALAGNIGTPVLSCDEYDGYVLELSSFQLDITSQLHPHIAAILNITPDHLDRHGTMEEYIAAKRQIFRNMEAGDSLILGIDNEYLYALYLELKAQSVAFNLLPFSTNKIEPGIFSVIDNKLHDNLVTNGQYDLSRNASLQGRHNSENIAASILASLSYGLKIDDILQTLPDYSGLPHRMQFLGKNSGVQFYNDSKATNIESCIPALQSFENIYWLAGGISKSADFSFLESKLKNVTHGFFFGKSSEQLAIMAENIGLVYSLYDSMEEASVAAAEMAINDAQPAIVLLSPACSSFDQFDNFMHRGRVFTDLVKKYLS